MQLSWATPFYLLALYGAWVFFRPVLGSQERLTTRQKVEKGLGIVGLVIAIYFAAQFIGALVALLVPVLKGKNLADGFNYLQDNTFGQFCLILAVEAATVWLLLYYIARHKMRLAHLGIRRPRWSDIGYVFIGFLIYIVSFVGISSALKSLVPSLNVDQNQQLGFHDVHGGSLVFVFLSLVILPPLVEELVMRGFLYGQLKKYWRRWVAVVMVSILFAIAHLQAGTGQPLLWIAAIDTFMLSLALIYVREKSGGLWSSIGLHALKNLIAFLALFVFH